MSTISKNEAPANRLLHEEQLKASVDAFFVNVPVTVLRIIPRTGKYKQGTSWIYLQNDITGDRWATFLSFTDILRGFWTWFETAKLMALALWQRIAIGKVIWQDVRINEKVYHQGYGWGTVVEKDFTVGKGIPRLWVEFRSSDSLHHFLPTDLQYT